MVKKLVDKKPANPPKTAEETIARAIPAQVMRSQLSAANPAPPSAPPASAPTMVIARVAPAMQVVSVSRRLGAILIACRPGMFRELSSISSIGLGDAR